MKSRLPVAVLVLLGAPSLVYAQVRPIYDTGASALARQLERLQTTASVLHTGAHPDDEDSPLVAYHARAEDARTAYVSLTRGAGGQNLVGPEQSALLGVIRTEELLQARTLDGAAQFFTRAIDYGFSKHRDEAARVWAEETLLEDMVRTIRLFRPDVVVSRFGGTPADGHGHHQFAGYLTPLAVAAAADADRYPSMTDEGLSPWRVKKLYAAARGLYPREDVLRIDTGEFDPVAGRSYFEIGMHGRSQQRTQSMGQIEFRGSQVSVLTRVDDSPRPESSVFDGLDTSISGIGVHQPDAPGQLTGMLAELEETLQQALNAYDAREPQGLVPVLADGLRLARAARALATHPDAVRLLDEKIAELQHAVALATGIVVDALASAETVVPGGRLQLAVRLYDPQLARVKLEAIELELPSGWSSGEGQGLDNEAGYRRRDGATHERYFEIEVPRDARLTAPYWLAHPATGFEYDWSEAGSARGLPFGPSPVTALVVLEIGGQQVMIRSAAQHRVLDRVRGELRRRIDVVPPVSVAASTDLLVVSTTTTDRVRRLPVTVSNNTHEPLQATIAADAPSDWHVSLEPAAIELPPFPASATLSLAFTIPDDAPAGRYRLAPVVTVGREEYRQTMHVVAYPHIRTHRVYEPADVALELVDLRVATVNVGYVMGSGDRVPGALRQLGVDVTLLDDEQLQTGDLQQFDTIIVGIRASQARPAFVANNGRLLDFARQGGTLIVQYQQPDYVAKGLAPYDARMDGSVRVVDETAAVEILQPRHPVFTFPNEIAPSDFDGWVQERNNYNFTSYDSNRYLPLTESHDPGEAPSTGAMLYAELGNGHFVYTSYSWFRQLPNGVPGAYRLFANLISLPAAEFQ